MSETPGWTSPGGADRPEDPTPSSTPGSTPPAPPQAAPSPVPAGPPAAPAPAPAAPAPPSSAPGHGPPPAASWWVAPPAPPKPGVIPLRPIGLGEILDASVSYIRRNPRATLGLAGLVAAVNGVIQVVVLGLVLGQVPSLTDTSLNASGTGSSTSTDVVVNGVQVLQSGLSVLLQIVATGMLTFVMGQAVLGRSVTARAAWDRVRPLLWRLIGVALLTGFLVAAVFFLCLVPGLLALIAGSDVLAVLLLVVGAIGAIVAAVWVYTVLILAPPALVLERTGVVEALQRSRALVAGAFWRVLGISILASLLASILSSIITLPFGAAAGITGYLVAGDGEGALKWALFGAALGGAVGTLVTLPFGAGVTSLLYIDRRMRREGLDLELARAAGVTSTAPVPAGSVPPGGPVPGAAPPGVQQW